MNHTLTTQLAKSLKKIFFLESPQPRGSKNSGKNMFESFKKSGKISKDLTIDEWKEKDLSNCILSGDPECAFVEGTKNDLPVAYLCGQDDFCKIVEDRRALRQAI